MVSRSHYDEEGHLDEGREAEDEAFSHTLTSQPPSVLRSYDAQLGVRLIR